MEKPSVPGDCSLKSVWRLATVGEGDNSSLFRGVCLTNCVFHSVHDKSNKDRLTFVCHVSIGPGLTRESDGLRELEVLFLVLILKYCSLSVVAAEGSVDVLSQVVVGGNSRYV